VACEKLSAQTIFVLLTVSAATEKSVRAKLISEKNGFHWKAGQAVAQHAAPLQETVWFE
jgi:hypothetical protein